MTTHREQVEALSRTIESSHGLWGAGDLKDAVDQAVRIAAPLGVPGSMDTLGHAYTAASGDTSNVRTEVQNVGEEKLPDAWTGKVGEKAAEVVGASADDLSRMSDAFSRVGGLLSELCDVLAKAQALHARGSGPLIHASQLLADITGWGGVPDPVNWDDDKMHEAHSSAKEGIGYMLTAAQQAEEEGHRAASELNRLAAEAKGGRMKGGDLSAADRLVLTDVSAPGDQNLILSANDATRAGQFMDRMSSADRQRIDSLLGGAKSPEERAYLLKALAAGHSVDDVAAFDEQIHNHGDDPSWLADRLTPIRLDSLDPATGAANRANVLYQGGQWTQGQSPTCVASSTVTARAMVDPVYSLQLTTGGHPGDPQYDNRDAFSKRLKDEQDRVYGGGRSWYQDLPVVGQDGMTDGQSNDVANAEIGAHTGTDYHNVSLDSDDARRDTLVDVEKAVDDGKPVPVSIDGDGHGHQMMIVGHSGDKLQIYNPWGYTVWVSEDDFVHNRMDSALYGPPKMNTATSVRLPN